MTELIPGYRPQDKLSLEEELKQKHQQELSKLHDLIEELRMKIIQEQTAAERAKDHAKYLNKKRQELERRVQLAASSQQHECLACAQINKYLSPEIK